MLRIGVLDVKNGGRRPPVPPPRRGRLRGRVDMSPLDFFEWVGDLQWSVDLHESQYAYSIIESIHVWTMAMFFGLVAMFDLRLMGLTMRQVPVSEVIRRLQPWTIAGFAIMVISGSLLFFAIPVRSYQNLFFRGKMLLLLLAALNIWVF